MLSPARLPCYTNSSHFQILKTICMFSEASDTEPADTASNRPESEIKTDLPRPQRILIGSERDRGTPTEAKPKPVTPASPPAAPVAPKKREPKHYPPPNIRDQLSPDLEAEYQAALGDMSLEALIEQAAGGEVAVELAHRVPRYRPRFQGPSRRRVR